MSLACGHEDTKTGKKCERPPGVHYWLDDMGSYPLCDAHAKAYVARELPVSTRGGGDNVPPTQR